MAAPHQRLHRASGFTLVELLVYVSVATVVLAAAAHTVLSSIRSSTNLESARRGIETWARITQFIAAEVTEGTEISFGKRYELCIDSEGDKNSAISLFSIAVPYSKGDWTSPNLTVFDSNNNQIWVHYATRLNADKKTYSLVRCGPPFDENGNLRGNSRDAYESMIHPRVKMELDPTPGKNSAHRITYTLNLSTAKTGFSPSTEIFDTPRRATATTGQQLID